LQPHEEIVWAGQTPYGTHGWVGGVLVMLFGIFFALIGFLTISVVGIGFGLFFALLGGGLWYQTLKQTGTRLYLTSYRLIRTRHGTITNQISRQIFRGKNLAVFLRVSATEPTAGMTAPIAWKLSTSTYSTQTLETY